MRTLRLILVFSLLCPSAGFSAVRIVPRSVAVSGAAGSVSAIGAPLRLAPSVSFSPGRQNATLTPAVSLPSSDLPASARNTEASASVSPASARPAEALSSPSVLQSGQTNGRVEPLTNKSHRKLADKAGRWAKSLGSDFLPDPAGTTADAYIDALSQLLDVENEAQEAENRRMRSVALKTREELGVSIGDLSAEDAVERHGRSRVLYLSQRRPNAASPFHAISRGDLVEIAGADGVPFQGTVYSVSGNRVGVAIDGELPAKKGLRLEITTSDVTHKRMKAALENLRTTENKHTVRLRDVLFGKRKARSGPLPDVRFRNKGLNEFQKEAVRSALASEDVSLIHGPPGTGKTTTLVELIYQAVTRGDSVLASAPSNVAVDNILDKLIDTGLNVVRIGHPARVPEHLRPYTLDVIAEKTVAGRAIAGLKKRLEDVDANGAEARRLRSSIREYEKKLHDKILSQADVILGTHATTNRPLRKKAFDLAVLDEASQSVEPLSWIPLQQAKRVVFAGDTRQLPPTLHSAEAEKAGLGRTLMERLMSILPESLQTLLRVQYRMNADIMSFSSDEFYAGRLIAHDSVSKHTAKDLPGVRNTELTRTPAQYIDTAGADYRENFDALTQSYFNEGEAALIEKLYKNLIASGLAPDQIGIVTPYSAQKRLLREKLGEDGPEIHTVDGFQGREKEVLLVSMVRSNDKRELGFLEEFRRLNVALTRPRRLRVVVGDSATLSRHDLYRRFLAQAEEKGQYRSAFEWMD